MLGTTMSRTTMSRTTILAALLALSVLSPALSWAQTAAAKTWPTKPLRLLVPYAAGGGADAVARPVMQKLGEALGQQILYENQGSSGGIIAAQNVARAAPDLSLIHI